MMTNFEKADINQVQKAFIDSFIVDLENKKFFDNKLKPTQITYKKAAWLWATNKKYPKDIIDPNKVGKWMVFIPRRHVNQVWERIKKGILNTELWSAKVSTKTPDTNIHAIMIYTKDYTDLKDVIRVLNYLENTNIKPKYKNIRYKTDQQTHAGIYSGGKERPWIYASETIRSMTNNNASASTTSTITVQSIATNNKLIESRDSSISEQTTAPKLLQTRANLFQPKKNSSSHSSLYVIPALRKKVTASSLVSQEEIVIRPS